MTTSVDTEPRIVPTIPDHCTILMPLTTVPITPDHSSILRPLPMPIFPSSPSICTIPPWVEPRASYSHRTKGRRRNGAAGLTTRKGIGDERRGCSRASRTTARRGRARTHPLTVAAELQYYRAAASLEDKQKSHGVRCSSCFLAVPRWDEQDCSFPRDDGEGRRWKCPKSCLSRIVGLGGAFCESEGLLRAVCWTTGSTGAFLYFSDRTRWSVSQRVSGSRSPNINPLGPP